jgi:hypothetical protein
MDRVVKPGVKQNAGDRPMTDQQTAETPDVNSSDPPKLTADLKAMAQDYLELAKLRMQLAVSVGLRLFIVAIIAALALVSAWLALMGAVTLGLIRQGMPPEGAMLCLAAANVLIAWYCWHRLQRLSQWLDWSKPDGAKPNITKDEPRGDS